MLDDLLAALRSHTNEKAVGLFSFPVVGLKRSFHLSALF
jgi:hypothetical protein